MEYSMLPDKKTLYLVSFMWRDICLRRDLYGCRKCHKGRHQSALQEGRSIRSLINLNNKKIRVINGFY